MVGSRRQQAEVPRLIGDGKQQRLERMLPKIAAGMELMSESLKKRRLMWEKRDWRWAEESAYGKNGRRRSKGRPSDVRCCTGSPRD